MKWYLAKLVFRIICGDGNHTPQFDEQLRLFAAGSEKEAFKKAASTGKNEEEIFHNVREQLVCWRFVNVSELYMVNDLIDGAELYSRISEVDDAEAYINFVNRKAESIRDKPLLKLI